MLPGDPSKQIDLKLTEQQLIFLDELLENVADMQEQVRQARGKNAPVQALTTAIRIRITAALAANGYIREA